MPRKNSKLKYTIEIFKLLKKYGTNINMDDLAVELRLTKKTLYNNYLNKEDMLKEVMVYFFGEVDEKVKAVLLKSENSIDSLFKVSKIITDEISDLGKVFLRDISLYKNTFIIFDHTDRMSYYSRIIRENLERGVAEKLYRDDLDIDYVVLFYTAAIERFYKWDSKFIHFEDSINFHKKLIKYHLYSVTNLKGRKILEAYL